MPWVNFTAALSNAGYAKNRSSERHDIFMSFLLRKYPDLLLRDDRRLFDREQKLAILIVEQNVHHVLRAADRAYVLENGRIVMQGAGTQLLADERLKVAYLGL